MTERKKSFPHTYVIVFFLLILAGLLTWVLPGGEFDRVTKNVEGVERTVVVPGSFHFTTASPQGWGIFMAIFDGFVERADIIVFILLIGASFFVINQTKAIDIGVLRLMHWLKKWEQQYQYIHFDEILLISIMIVFSLFGAVFGMSEETIAFVPIFIPLALRLGYDSLVAVAMCFVAATLGFTGALLNPFTIGIAQGIAELPLFSGLEYRLLIFLVINAIGFFFILRYARKVKRNPQISPVYTYDEFWRQMQQVQNEHKTTKTSWHTWLVHLAISIGLFSYALALEWAGQDGLQQGFPWLSLVTVLYVVVATWLVRKKSKEIYVFFLTIMSMVLLVIGVVLYDWYIREIATMFLLLGILAGIAYGYRANELVKHMLDGAKDIFSAAFVVGLAAGIILILKNGHVVDTMLYYLSSFFEGNKLMTITGMYLVSTLFNVILPSGSAKAALLMPLLAPLADMVEVSRQTAVVAYQLGDGFTNMITPVSGVLLGVLTMAKIPYVVWVKWIWKLILIMFVLGWALLLPVTFMKWPGF